MIAIVVYAGSAKGKSRHQLNHFYEYQQGLISVDKEDIRDHTKRSVRSQIGLVQQDAFMFYGDFYDNIRLHGNYSDEEVREAAEFTGADHFIKSMEDGYRSHIS